MIEQQLRTPLTELAGVRHPVVQTGMGWVAGPSLVSGTANAGGLGILASATMNRRWMSGRTRTSRRTATTTATTTCPVKPTPAAEATAAAAAPPASMRNTKSTVAASIAARISAIPSQASHGFSANQSIAPPLPLAVVPQP